MKYAVENSSCGMIHVYLISFMKIGNRRSSNIEVCLKNLRGCNVGITYGRDV
jgi:hypothetical protein